MAGQAETSRGVQAGLQATSLHPSLPDPTGCQAEDQADPDGGWLQRVWPRGRPWGPLDILQGEAPTGDVYPGSPTCCRYSGGKWETGRGQGMGLAGQMPYMEPLGLASGRFRSSWAHP